MADQAEQHPGQNTPDPQKTPLPLEEDGSNVPSNEEQPQRPSQEEAIVRQYKILNKITAALVFVGAVSLLVNFLMWNQMIRQANISENQLKLSRKSSENQLRAYLTISRVDSSFVEKKAFSRATGIQFTYPFSIKNVGQTPAYRFQAIGALMQQDSIRQKDFDVIENVGASNPIVLNPGSEINFFPSLQPPKGDPAKARTFLLGISTFSDAFDSSRSFQFCYEYIYIVHAFNPYGKFNTAN